MTAPTLEEEQQRLRRLRELRVLDSAPEPLFDSIAQLASQICGTPITLVSLVDADRQWFKANIGLPGVSETPRDVAFCAHAIADDGLFEVPDATADPRFAGNPLVTGQPDIRFYAGAPLVLPDGERVGTLCVIDRQPRRLDAAQAGLLHSLAAIASQALVLRRDLMDRALSVRSQYEMALAASEARHRAIVEEQSELVSLARADGELVYVNPAFARHFGRTPAVMIGANLFDVIDPADRDAVRRQVAAVLNAGHPVTGENRVLSVDGSERWVAWSHGVQREADGRLLLHSVGRDVTERRRVEQALRACQSFLRSAGRVAGVGGWQLELASGAITWSEETRRLHEVGPDYQPALDTALSFYAPEARPTITDAVQRGLERGDPWDLELPFITATGRALWVRAVGEVEFDKGRAVRLIGAFQDISERKQLEHRLAEREDFLRRITDNLPVRMAYVDRERRYRFVNLAHCQRYGRERDNIIGATRSAITQGATDAVVEPRIDAVLAGEAQRFEFDEMVHGRMRRIECQLVPDVSERGEVIGFFTTGVDVTERSAAEKALRELTEIFDNTTDYVVQLDWRGQVVYMNPAVRRATGLGPDEPVTQRQFSEFNSPATNRLFSEVIAPAVQEKGVWVGDTHVLLAGRREVPVSHMVIAHRDATGRVDRYSAVMRDISAEVRAKAERLRQSATLRSVTEAIPALVAVVGADGCYRFVNSSFERWTGVRRSRTIGRSLPEVLGTVEYERSRRWVQRVLAGETVNFEKNYPGRDGEKHLSISFIPLWLQDGVVDGFVAVGQDITQHKREELRLLRLSQRDPLTGLLNRAGFEGELERHLSEKGGASLALLYIDLDHFKPVNDVYGHPVGDRVLQMFAQRLQTLVRPTDAVARLGGDEFALLLFGVREQANANTVAAKVVAAAGAPFSVGDAQLHIGASVGVAFGVDPVSGWGDLVARADAMLYQAKQAGRGRHAEWAG